MSAAPKKTPKGLATEGRVLEAIQRAEREERDWTYASIAEEVCLTRTAVHHHVGQLVLKGLLAEGARRVVKVGLVVANPPAAAVG
ncbi:MAG: hypothetical protein ACOZQL_10905 [Myxococcota bacterium]